MTVNLPSFNPEEWEQIAHGENGADRLNAAVAYAARVLEPYRNAVDAVRYAPLFLALDAATKNAVYAARQENRSGESS